MYIHVIYYNVTINCRHADTTIIRLLATSKIRHIALPEDGPIGLKHVGEKWRNFIKWYVFKSVNM